MGRYSPKGRIMSAIETFREKVWVDGYKFTFIERVKRAKRAIENFKDIPKGCCWRCGK